MKKYLFALGSNRDNFLESYHSRQIFALSDSIMHYIAMMPASAKCYQKMVQTCKYFFIKNPIIIFENLNIRQDECFSTKKSCQYFIDLKKIKSKLWITDNFGVPEFGLAKKRINLKFYRIDAKTVNLCNDIISFKSVVGLFTDIKDMTLSYNVFMDETRIDSDDIFSLKRIKPNFIKQLLELPGFSKIVKFTICDITGSFDIETFFTQNIKKNKQIKFLLYFVFLFISQAYENRIEAIVDEILATENHDYKVPLFDNSGLENEKYWKMYSLFSEN